MVGEESINCFLPQIFFFITVFFSSGVNFFIWGNFAIKESISMGIYIFAELVAVISLICYYPKLIYIIIFGGVLFWILSSLPKSFASAGKENSIEETNDLIANAPDFITYEQKIEKTLKEHIKSNTNDPELEELRSRLKQQVESNRSKEDDILKKKK